MAATSSCLIIRVLPVMSGSEDVSPVPRSRFGLTQAFCPCHCFLLLAYWRNPPEPVVTALTLCVCPHGTGARREARCVTVENGTFLLCVHLMAQGISITPNYILLSLEAALCPHIDGSRTSLGILVILDIAAYKASFFFSSSK